MIGVAVMNSGLHQTIDRTSNETETEVVAARLAERLGPGDFVALIGPLGAGKSVFARAIGRRCGVTTTMPSPTYTLLAVHQGRCPIYHIDLYRINSLAELESAALQTYFDNDGICLVEWAERARSLWPKSGWCVALEAHDEQSRTISIERFGDDLGGRAA